MSKQSKKSTKKSQKPCPFTDEQLEQIGADTARTWGAICLDWEIQENSVIFNCVERHQGCKPEYFYSELSFEDIDRELRGEEMSLEELEAKALAISAENAKKAAAEARLINLQDALEKEKKARAKLAKKGHK